ncbi:uracil phosphoribosyltransferase [Aquimarina sp. AD10]|uniref:Uracil phosphoribosyltransferase n=1 Tax=Aquimarina aggregata TaxID=1642818 RepID=A0A162CSA0_9FLAO|nr:MULTISPECIES: uracil phosphoribosyltransferase [Aquimarina]AXT61810.1 uracil phosphoribosyltransferase [Aquimarina sp. AD10]KZS41424.1 uracil phosphoribosyltransferase [Aquimarina aggregata]RKN02608.1 uracil phosphoribosyltransferase [Aquimarina sp. AD10]
MKEFFEAIQSLFVDGLFLPFDALRALELESWTMANVINWLFMAIGFVAFLYWMKELKKFNDNNEENRDPKAHSFLKPD